MAEIERGKPSRTRSSKLMSARSSHASIYLKIPISQPFLGDSTESACNPTCFATTSAPGQVTCSPGSLALSDASDVLLDCRLADRHRRYLEVPVEKRLGLVVSDTWERRETTALEWLTLRQQLKSHPSTLRCSDKIRRGARGLASYPTLKVCWRPRR